MVFCFQNCSDLLREKTVLAVEKKTFKFETGGRDFAKFLRRLNRTIFKTGCSFKFVPGGFSDLIHYNTSNSN